MVGFRRGNLVRHALSQVDPIHTDDIPFLVDLLEKALDALSSIYLLLVDLTNQQEDLRSDTFASDCFLSCHHDLDARSHVLRLKNRLQQDFYGCSSFVDLEHLEPNRETTIQAALACRMGVVIRSRGYFGSKWCLRELGILTARQVLQDQIEANTSVEARLKTRRFGLVVDDYKGSSMDRGSLGTDHKLLRWENPWVLPRVHMDDAEHTKQVAASLWEEMKTIRSSGKVASDGTLELEGSENHNRRQFRPVTAFQERVEACVAQAKTECLAFQPKAWNSYDRWDPRKCDLAEAEKNLVTETAALYRLLTGLDDDLVNRSKDQIHLIGQPLSEGTKSNFEIDPNDIPFYVDLLQKALDALLDIYLLLVDKAHNDDVPSDNVGYDVFLSHRGQPAIKSFVVMLHRFLQQDPCKRSAFVDYEELKPGCNFHETMI